MTYYNIGEVEGKIINNSKVTPADKKLIIYVRDLFYC